MVFDGFRCNFSSRCSLAFLIFCSGFFATCTMDVSNVATIDLSTVSDPNFLLTELILYMYM